METPHTNKVAVSDYATAVLGLGGKDSESSGRSHSFSRAIESWAHAIHLATETLPFTRDEWNLIVSAVQGDADFLSAQPELMITGAFVGTYLHGLTTASAPENVQLLRQAVRDLGFDDSDPELPIEHLEAKIAALNHEQAWAVLIACLFYCNHMKRFDPEADDWWTIDFRCRMGRVEELPKRIHGDTLP